VNAVKQRLNVDNVGCPPTNCTTRCDERQAELNKQQFWNWDILLCGILVGCGTAVTLPAGGAGGVVAGMACAVVGEAIYGESHAQCRARCENCRQTQGCPPWTDECAQLNTIGESWRITRPGGVCRPETTETTAGTTTPGTTTLGFSSGDDCTPSLGVKTAAVFTAVASRRIRSAKFNVLVKRQQEGQRQGQGQRSRSYYQERQTRTGRGLVLIEGKAHKKQSTSNKPAERIDPTRGL
jgi:hypothetical protein